MENLIWLGAQLISEIKQPSFFIELMTILQCCGNLLSGFPVAVGQLSEYV